MWDSLVDAVKKIRSLGGTHFAAAIARVAEDDRLQGLVYDTSMNTEGLDIVDLMYSDAIQYASKRKDHNAMIHLKYHYAESLLKLPNPPVDTIMHTFESILEIGLELCTNPAFLLYRIGKYLGLIYYEQALQTRSSGGHVMSVAEGLLSKISKIACEQVSEQLLIFSPRMYLVRYFHLQGHEGWARAMSRNTLQLALEILSDDDLSNDILAFFKITNIAIAFSDKEVTASSFAMERLAYAGILSISEDREESPESSYMFQRGCDVCESKPRPGGTWVCTDCIDLCMCEVCRARLMDREFVNNFCDPSHRGFLVHEWSDERMEKIPPGHVPWGDKNITIDEWKKVLSDRFLPDEGVQFPFSP
jgi:hypothetical protein